MNSHTLLDRIPTLPKPRPRRWMRFGVWMATFSGMSLLCTFTLALLAALHFAILALAILVCFLLAGGFFGPATELVLPWLLGACLVVALIPVVRSLYWYVTWSYAEDETESLDPIDDPFLNELVARLCERLRAPRPAAIVATPERQAHAFPSNGHGFSIAINPNIFACLQTNDLACLLAHEIAHYPEVTRRRYLLLWNLKCYLEWILGAYFGADSGVPDRSYGTILPNLERLADRLFRFPGNSLFRLQTLLFAWYLRFHEYEADRLAVELLGRRAAGAAMRRLYSTGAAHMELEILLCDYFNAGWRVVDIGSLHAEYLKGNVPDGPFVRLAHMFSRDTNWDDTHPGRLDLLRLARRGPEIDLPTSDRPVSECFADFATIDRAASTAFYQKQGMKEFEMRPICESSALVKDYVHRQEASAAFERFLPEGSVYLDSWMDSFDTPFPFGPADGTEAEITARIIAARRVMQTRAELWQDQLERFKKAKHTLQLKPMSEWISDSRRRFPELVSDDRGLALGQIPDGPEHPREAMATAEEEMRPYVDAAVERIRCSMRLLCRPEFRRRISDGEEAYSRCMKVQPTLRVLVGLREAITTLDWIGSPLCLGYGSTKWNGWQRRQGQRLPEGIMRVLELIRAAFETLQAIGREVPCPHLDGTGTVTLFEYVAESPRIGMEDDEDAAVSDESAPEGSAEALFDELVLNLDIPLAVTGRYSDVVASTFGELARAAEAVETALGLPALELWEAF